MKTLFSRIEGDPPPTGTFPLARVSLAADLAAGWLLTSLSARSYSSRRSRLVPCSEASPCQYRHLGPIVNSTYGRDRDLQKD